MCATSSRLSVHLTDCRPGSRQGFQGTFPLRFLTISIVSDGTQRLLLGGGYGFLTGQHGLVVDNLLQVYSLSAALRAPPSERMTQATIVTANGTTLTLGDTENADLFWGIRGGGCNFGICTEFVLRLHPQRPTIFAGMVVYPTDVLKDLMTVLTQWWENVKNNEGILKILARDPLSGKVSDNTLSIAAVQSMTTACRRALV